MHRRLGSRKQLGLPSRQSHRFCLPTHEEMQSQWHSICPYLEKLIFLAFAIPQWASFRAFCRKSLDCAPSLHLQGDQQSVCGKTNIQRVGIVLPLYMKAVGMFFNSMHHIDSLSGQSRWNQTGSGVGSGNPVGTRGTRVLDFVHTVAPDNDHAAFEWILPNLSNGVEPSATRLVSHVFYS